MYCTLVGDNKPLLKDMTNQLFIDACQGCCDSGVGLEVMHMRLKLQLQPPPQTRDLEYMYHKT